MEPLAPYHGQALAALVARAVADRLAGRPVDGRPPASAVLRALGASFVTLELAGALRGCIGTLEASRPLYVDAVRNALRAMVDPRLPPVVADEWPELDISVTVLSAPQALPADSRDRLVAALRPGVDGLVLSDGRQRATFLPAVWHKLADPDRFVEALLDKGGWNPRGWPEGIRAQRYTAAEFTDRAPRKLLG
ncbi:MAG TPA: AmmeMemoRadiSam system protein A [Micromonosporaceae bacterium]|nr:AmmeMemoRadiSam system protein A [Micromonosporaceae bacterium]